MVARRGLQSPALLTSPPRSAFFVRLERWVAPLRALGRWPTVEEIDSTLANDAGVRFVRALPKGRTAKARDEARGYDEQIVYDGAVPTREENVHDLMNALVWAAFPKSKRALHVRQLELVRNAGESGQRTVEHDTIAMLDEGGVLLLCAQISDEASATPATSLVFGHALYQHLAEERGPVFGLGVPLFPASDVENAALETTALESADRALAGMLAERERFTSHRWFPRVRVE